MDIFRKRGLWAVTCPASNAKLASGIAPLTAFEEKNIRTAIGTDGAASNNALSMFREMYLAAVLQKLRCMKPDAIKAENVLKMAVSGSAKAMGLNECDCLAVGKQADMIVLDMNAPNMHPINNLVNNLVYSASDRNVVMTVVAGKILYENGKYNINVSPEEIYAKTDEYLSAMKKAL